MFVAVGEQGVVLTSADGTTWKRKNSGAYLDLRSIVYGDGRFVGVGNGGTIVTCSNDTTWILGYCAIVTGFLSVTYDSNQFVSVGSYSELLTSPDGGVWTEKASNKTSSPRFMAYSNGWFVALGNEGAILTSQDCTNWNTEKSGTINNLYCVTFGKNQFVTVGDLGTILTSTLDKSGIKVKEGEKKVGTNRISATMANNSILIKFPSMTPLQCFNVSLFNISGKKVYSGFSNVNERVLRIPASGFPAGNYYISITTDKNRITSSKFVLMR
jgi:hypothetical protein